MQPTHAGLFGARTAVLLSAFAFAAVERRFADRQSRTLEYMARHDPLTGLLNRRAFEERLDEAIARGRRYRRRFAILAIDIDRFKPVNDAHGHAAGDELLRELADRIRAATRATDAASRVGGDEFIVLLEEVLEDKNVALLARRMLASLMSPAEISGVSIDVGASIGIVTFPDAASEALPLVRAADLAMYRAKSAGGGSLHFHDSMDPALRD
jgi:diguanylate cyclase (GGDEF)-like protein